MSPFDNTNAIKHLAETWRHQVNRNTSQKLGFFVPCNHGELQGEPGGPRPSPQAPALGWSRSGGFGRKAAFGEEHEVCNMGSPWAEKQELIRIPSSPVSEHRAQVWPVHWEPLEPFCSWVPDGRWVTLKDKHGNSREALHSLSCQVPVFIGAVTHVLLPLVKL